VLTFEVSPIFLQNAEMLLYSPAYVVLLGLFLTLLSLQALVLRLKYRRAEGDGAGLVGRATEAHAVTLEFSVVFVPLLICSELMGASNEWIAATSLAFLLGRLVHSSALLTLPQHHWSTAVGAAVSHCASVALMLKLVSILLTI
jgi:uncharacterized membrane protein YecN with MAPEG domain